MGNSKKAHFVDMARAVLLDIGTPVENGYQAQRIRQLPNGNNLLLVALSGYAQAQDSARSLEAGSIIT